MPTWKQREQSHRNKNKSGASHHLGCPKMTRFITTVTNKEFKHNRRRGDHLPTCSSHRSTRPFASAGMILRGKSTFSFSADSMATMTFSKLKVSWAIPSKHFLRWGWTRRGSLVSDKISRSSSLDRKKNLESSGIQLCYNVYIENHIEARDFTDPIPKAQHVLRS